MSREQDPGDHAGQLEGADSGFLQDWPVQLAIDGGGDQCTEHAHGGRLGRGRQTTDDRSEHHDNDADGQQYGTHRAQLFGPTAALFLG